MHNSRIMTDKVLPTHIEFAWWFIKIRWIAICLLIIITLFATYFFNVTLEQDMIFLIAGILLLVNVGFLLRVRKIKNTESTVFYNRATKNIHTQVVVDFITLAVILHYSGGIENPFVFCYVFHMIVVSAILTPRESYLLTGFALLLIGILAFTECFGFIEHFPLTGFVQHDLYKNQFYIYTTGSVFIITTYFLVSLTNRLAIKSRMAEDSFMKANIELEKKDQVKNEYVMRLTHEIKGHLAAIQASLSVLKENLVGELNDKQADFVIRSHERTTQLSGFINDLFELTKKRIETADMFITFPLKESIAKVLNEIKPLASEKSVNVISEIDENISTINGIQFSIEELFTNLLMNAIKYSTENGIVKLTGIEKYDKVIFKVSDNGIGITSEEIPKVFDELYRAESIKDSEIGGSGLGLSIARQIVTTHGGKIWVESKPGEGSCFTFYLPKNNKKVLRQNNA